MAAQPTTHNVCLPDRGSCLAKEALQLLADNSNTVCLTVVPKLWRMSLILRKQSPLQQGPLQEQYTRQLQQQEEEKEDEEEKQSQHEAGQAVARMAKTTTLAVSPRLPKKRSPRSRILTSRIGVSVPRECAQAQQQAEEEEEEEEEELGLRDSMRVTASLRSSSRRPPQQHWLVLSADITACYPVFEVDFDLERLHLSPRSL